MSNERTQASGAAGSGSERVDSDPEAQEARLARPAVPPRPASASRPSNGPTYSEKQVAEILQRAASLERGRQLEKPELTIEEIEAIARESGLDSSFVRVAAQSLPVVEKEKSLGARLAGAPTWRVVERIVSGRSHPPQVSTIGRSLNMTGSVGSGNTEIDIIPRDGKTLIRIDISTAQESVRDELARGP